MVAALCLLLGSWFSVVGDWGRGRDGSMGGVGGVPFIYLVIAVFAAGVTEIGRFLPSLASSVLFMLVLLLIGDPPCMATPR